MKEFGILKRDIEKNTTKNKAEILEHFEFFKQELISMRVGKVFLKEKTRNMGCFSTKQKSVR